MTTKLNYVKQLVYDFFKGPMMYYY